MKIVIGGNELKLNHDDVAAASSAINELITGIKKVSVEKNRPQLYFTALILLYAKSKETIDAITPSALKYMLDLIEETEKARQAVAQEMQENLQA